MGENGNGKNMKNLFLRRNSYSGDYDLLASEDDGNYIVAEHINVFDGEYIIMAVNAYNKMKDKIEDIEKIKNIASQIIDLSNNIRINDGWND